MRRLFDVDLAFKCIRVGVGSFPKAALFELADEGFNSIPSHTFLGPVQVTFGFPKNAVLINGRTVI